MTLLTMKVLRLTVLLYNLAFPAICTSYAYCKYIWCECEPCENSTIIENCTYPTTQATANSQKPLIGTSKSKMDDIPGAAIGGALFGFVVTAIVSVYIHRGLSFRTGRRSLNNVGYRKHEFNNDKIPKQLGDDSVIYNEITDETQIDKSIQTIQNKEAAQRNYFHELDKAGRTTSDDYDHAGPAKIVVKEPQKGTHNAEQCKEHTDDTDKAKILQTSIHAEESAKTEQYLEPKKLDTTTSDNHNTSATNREDERGMASKVEELDKILHNIQSTALSECGITSGSENEQNDPYFSLESQ
ncbi:uncharacterized protein LOC111109903 isoform X2 [Crassostrea virginica]